MATITRAVMDKRGVLHEEVEHRRSARALLWLEIRRASAFLFSFAALAALLIVWNP